MDDPRDATKRLFPSRLTRRQALVGVGLALAVPRIGTGRAAPATPETGSRLAAHPPLAEIEATLPKTAARLAGAIERGGGGQLSVSRRGTVVVDAAWGATGAGAAITPDSLVPWASASKPTTCVALMRLVEAGRLGLDDRVVEHIPEFGANGKEDVLVRHLLTHTAHLGGYDGPVAAARESWDRTIAKIVAAPLAAGQGAWRGLPRGREARPAVAPSAPAPAPGTDPGYNPAGIWIIGELLRRRHGIPFAELIRDELFLPTGMADSWNGMPADRFRTYGDRIVGGVGRINAPQVKAEAADKANPGGGGVGPTRDLARFYEMLLNGGEIGGNRLLRPETVAEMTALQATDGGLWAWGLGFHLNQTATDPAAAARTGARAAADLFPSGPRFGRYASARAFGHSGATGMVAFADPDAGLVVGLIGTGTDVIDAIYEDLGLA